MARVASSEAGAPPEQPAASRWHVPAERLAGGETAAKWQKLSTGQKVQRVVGVFLKIGVLFTIIFCFICSLGLLTDAFKLIGVRGIGHTIKSSSLIQNPVSASILGMMSTLVLQNGSTLVSILVGMVASGLITVHHALPIIIGSEMGASLTNALISLAQSGDRNKFRRSFAAATMNDAFNILNYMVLLPSEISFGVIEKLSGMMVQPLVGTKGAELKTLNLLTDPLLEEIVHIDDEAINAAIAAGENHSIPIGRDTFIFRCVDLDTKEIDPNCPYDHLFAYSFWSDAFIGSVLLAFAIFALICCLVGIVQTMQSLLAGRVAVLARRLLDQECPHPFEFLTGYLVMLVGALIVFVLQVQSNTVLRSALTPLVGIGVVTLDRLYPLLLGERQHRQQFYLAYWRLCSADPIKLKETLQIALCETLCNIFGVLAFYPIPFFRKLPMRVAMTLGDLTATYRWFSLVYIALFFFITPASLLALSFLSTHVMVGVLASLITFVVSILLINWLQGAYPTFLPEFLRTWEFLPLPLRSLGPYDGLISRYFSAFGCCRNHFITPPPQPPPAELLGTIASDPKAQEEEENRAAFIREIMRKPPSHVDTRGGFP
ncbi:hypothetical protein M3Y99_00805000 [Aphelenchoides fujianensis]|nr:hypothetical protein M3Y99_00805000 [Aphelenchoides fujianensis]